MIRNSDEIRPYVTKDSSIIKEIFHPDNSKVKSQSLALAVVSAGKATLLHSHRISEEIYFVLEGEGIISLDGKESRIKKHDSILIMPGKKHFVRNTGHIDLKFLCSCSPVYGHDDAYLE